MDLASGYSDSINYGNGYTPLANNAINNNNADYWRNQAATALMAQNAQNNVFASGGGFGQQTADYAGAGAAYGRATGGFGGAVPGMEYFYQEQKKLGEGGIGSDAARSPDQPASFNDRFSAAPQNQPYGPGYFDNTFGSVSNTGGTSFAPYQGVQPMTPQQPIQYPQAGGFGSMPQVPGMEYFYREMYGSPFQNTGMSTEDRSPAEVPAYQFPTYPNQQKVDDWRQSQTMQDAGRGMTVLSDTPYYNNSETPGWGTSLNFPTAPAYRAPNPDWSFGSEEYPNPQYDFGEAGTRLLDPNLLDRGHQQQQNMGSG